MALEEYPAEVPEAEADIRAYIEGVVADAVVIADAMDHQPDLALPYDAETIRWLAAVHEVPRVQLDEDEHRDTKWEPPQPDNWYDPEISAFRFVRGGWRNGTIRTLQIHYAMIDWILQGLRPLRGEEEYEPDLVWRVREALLRIELGNEKVDEWNKKLAEQEDRKRREDERRERHRALLERIHPSDKPKLVGDPGVWAEDEDGARLFEDGTRYYLGEPSKDDRFHYPDRRVVYPDGTVQYLGGSRNFAGKRVSFWKRWEYPDGTVEYPDGRFEYPDGHSDYPYGHFDDEPDD